jgi:lysophospholipase L1-like esterase
MQIHSSQRTRLAGRTLQLGLVITLAITLALAAEFVIRQTAPELGNRRHDGVFTGSFPLELNDRGYRGSLPSSEMAHSVIICLGDSTTFGTGVAADSTWPARLEAHLRSDEDKPMFPVESINAAQPGADLRQLLASLETTWSDYKPSAVVAALSGNMVSFALIRDSTNLGEIQPRSAPTAVLTLRQRLRYLPSDSALVGAILAAAETIAYSLGVYHHRVDPDAPYGAMLAHGWRQAGLPPQRALDAWQAVKQKLEALRDWCSARDVPLIVTWIPTRFSISESLFDNLKFVPKTRLAIDANERCRQVCTEIGVEFVDVLSKLQSSNANAGWGARRESIYIHRDYTHLAAAGHNIVAEAIAAHVHQRIAQIDR